MSTGGSIDVHAHYLPPFYAEEMHKREMWIVAGLPVPEWSPEQALEFMDAHGVAKQILSVSDPGVEFVGEEAAPALARRCNDYGASLVASHPDRFGALGVLALSSPEEAVSEAVRTLDNLNLDGVSMLSSVGGRYPGDPAFEVLMSELNARAAWVFVHPTVPDLPPALGIPESVVEFPFDTTRAIISLIFNGVFDRHPRIRWHFAHGGGTIAMLRLRLQALARNAKDLGQVIGLPEGAWTLTENSVPNALLSSFFDTALIADAPSLEAVGGIAGPGKVMFGSDWPFAGRLYPPTGTLQPAIEDVFDRTTSASVRRGAALGQFKVRT